MFNDCWIFLQHEKTLFSDSVDNDIYFCIERNAETERVDVSISIDVWDEHGIKLEYVDFHSGGRCGHGVELYNIPEDSTYVTCILQIRKWNAIPINRAQG